MKSIQKITPFLWFDDQALEAAKFYVSLFPSSRITDSALYEEAGVQAPDKAKGPTMTVEFKLAGQTFVGLNGGPSVKFTPAISFFVGCYTEEEIGFLYKKLSDGGGVLMELAAYPFAKKYAWVKDRYGVSWQLSLATRPGKITPLLMFTGNNYGKAEEAMDYYVELFKERDKETGRREVAYYEETEAKGKVVQGVFSLSGQEFIATDSPLKHDFNFTGAISFAIDCKNQEDVDYYWDKLCLPGKPGQCGWLEDKYGVSWQVIPSVLKELLGDADPVKRERLMKCMLQMTKPDIELLKKAYANSL